MTNYVTRDVQPEDRRFPELWAPEMVEGADYDLRFMERLYVDDVEVRVYDREPATPFVGTVTAEDRITRAMSYVVRYGGIDGDHHKQWLITQMAKALLGSPEAWAKWELAMRGAYDEENEEYEYGEWDEGIPP